MNLQQNHCSKCAWLYFFEPSALPGIHDNDLCFTCLAADRSGTAEEVVRLEMELEAAADLLGDSEEEIEDLQIKLKAIEIELKEYAATIIRRDSTIKTLESELAELEEATKQLTEVLKGQTADEQ